MARIFQISDVCMFDLNCVESMDVYTKSDNKTLGYLKVRFKSGLYFDYFSGKPMDEVKAKYKEILAKLQPQSVNV